MTARLRRQIVHAPLSSDHSIRDVEVGNNVQCLGDNEAKAKPNELLRGTEHELLPKMNTESKADTG